MDGYWTASRRTVTLPNPMVCIPSAVSPNAVSNPVRAQFSGKILLLLIGVFVFVSLMIGIILWILQYEIKKNQSNPQSIISLHRFV